MKRGDCAYSGENGAKVHPGFKCPPCDGEVKIQRTNFYVGEARKKLGPHMYLCEAHTRWYFRANPLTAIERLVSK